MPRLIITPAAVVGVARCHRFLSAKAPDAARRAGQAINRQLMLLQTLPEIGRPVEGREELRELVIAFGDAGYVALYRYDKADDCVYVLAFRHQREAGF